MSLQFSFGHGLLRAAASLGFLVGLFAQQTLHSQPATSEPLPVTSEAIAGDCGAAPSFFESRSAVFAGATFHADVLQFNWADSMLEDQVEIGLPREFGVALEDEDSIEMFRFDIQQRTFGVDRAVIRSGIASKVVRNPRSSISLPLLV